MIKKIIYIVLILTIHSSSLFAAPDDLDISNLYDFYSLGVSTYDRLHTNNNCDVLLEYPPMAMLRNDSESFGEYYDYIYLDRNEFSRFYDINDAQEILTWSADSNGTFSCVVDQNGNILSRYGVYYDSLDIHLTLMNNNGTIVGNREEDMCSYNKPYRGFWFKDNVWRFLSHPNIDPSPVIPEDATKYYNAWDTYHGTVINNINDNNIMVGFYKPFVCESVWNGYKFITQCGGLSYPHGTVYRNNQWFDIDFPYSDCDFPVAINNNNVIVGNFKDNCTSLFDIYATDRIYIYEENDWHTIRPPDDFCNADKILKVHDINDSGDILATCDGVAFFAKKKAECANPSYLTLAKMSKAAYDIPKSGSPPAHIDGYQYLVNGSGMGRDGYSVAIFKNDCNIVMAFRGTETASTFTRIKNLLSDETFVSGKPTRQFISLVAQSSESIKNIYSQYLGYNIFFTGHSLGGAVAQCAGLYSHIPTVVFNAPGVGGVEHHADILGALAPIFNIHPINAGVLSSVKNVRMYGDQVSLAHESAPVVKNLTIETIAGMTKYATYWSLALFNHSIDFVVARLADKALVVPGLLGGKAETLIALAKSGLLSYSVVIDVLKISPNFKSIDPPESIDCTLVGDNSSPSISWISLPVISGIESYAVMPFANGAFQNAHIASPGREFYFDSNIKGFKMCALNAGKRVSLPENFIFDISFNEIGVFSGKLIYSPVVNFIPAIDLLLSK